MAEDDHGYNLAHLASLTNFLYFEMYPSPVYSRKTAKLTYLSFQVWRKKVEQIQCLTPLPEDPGIPMLMRMLVPAPYQAPETKAKKKGKEAKSGLR